MYYTFTLWSSPHTGRIQSGSFQMPFSQIPWKAESWKYRGVTESSAEEESWAWGGRGGSPVGKVFMKEVHLRHSGHVDLHLLVSPFLSKISNCPLFQARSETRAPQHGRAALGKQARAPMIQHCDVMCDDVIRELGVETVGNKLRSWSLKHLPGWTGLMTRHY